MCSGFIAKKKNKFSGRQIAILLDAQVQASEWIREHEQDISSKHNKPSKWLN